MSGDLAQALEEREILLRRPDRLGEHRGSCPRCDRGPTDDALAVRIDGDGATWHCHRCGWKGGIGPAILEQHAKPAPPHRQRQPEPERHDTLAPWGGYLWASCRLIEPGTVAATYLERRVCALPHPDGDLRWHPDLLDRASNYRGPALVGRVTNAQTGEPINLLRTWVASDGSGKAPIGKPRRLLKGHRSCGVVRLWPDAEVSLGLTVGEGIETCLAAAGAGLTPVWSTLTAGNMAAFPVLAGLEGITILVDHDRPNPRTDKRAGIEAAQAVVRRYVEAGIDPNRDLVITLPHDEGLDVADLAASKESDG